MQIKYLGPSPFVNVGGYGPHYKGKVKDYPKEAGEELLATAKKQEFEAVPGKSDSDKAKAEAKAKARQTDGGQAETGFKKEDEASLKLVERQKPEEKDPILE
ncbi:MAG: hypothetical protein JRI34_03250, partial [Deltaproteobacteria bacterium]|nr:hypothetical protein [Deltaproteobacteria bacterium]